MTPSFLSRWRLDDSDAPKVALDDVAAFADACAELAGDPIFGVTLGFGLPRGAYGVVEFLWRSAPTFGKAIEAAARFSPVVSEVMQIRSQVLADRIRVGYPLPMGAPSMGRQGNLFVVGFAAKLFREMSSDPRLVPLAIGVAHRGAEPQATEVLRTEVRCGQLENWIELPRSAADHRVASSDPALFEALVTLLAGVEASNSKPRTFREQLGREIARRLAKGSVDVDTLAKVTHLRPRVLQRKLALEGTNVSELVDAVRRVRAAELLADPRRSLDDVAFELGFSELSAFVRAYRRWTGNSPGAARRARTGGSSSNERP